MYHLLLEKTSPIKLEYKFGLFLCFSISDCPAGWEFNGGSCYMFSTNRTSWSNANVSLSLGHLYAMQSLPLSIRHAVSNVIYTSCILCRYLYVMQSLPLSIRHVISTVIYTSCSLYRYLYVMQSLTLSIRHAVSTVIYTSCSLHRYLYVMQSLPLS